MERSEIEFKSGSILRKEMLQSLYEYPRIAVESMFFDYSDGILYGMTWKEVSENQHLISPGALKFCGNIYFLKREIDVEKELGNELSINGSYRLCFVLQEAEKQIESKTDYYLKLMALQDEDYKKVEDSSYWYAYINFSGEKKIDIITGNKAIKYGIAGLSAADDGYKFQLPNWLLRQQLLPVLEPKTNKHPLDYSLLREVYAGRPISISFVNVYLNELGKGKIDDDCTPDLVFNQLMQAVNELTLIVPIEPSVNHELKKKEPSHLGGGLL